MVSCSASIINVGNGCLQGFHRFIRLINLTKLTSHMNVSTSKFPPSLEFKAVLCTCKTSIFFCSVSSSRRVFLYMPCPENNAGPLIFQLLPVWGLVSACCLVHFSSVVNKATSCHHIIGCHPQRVLSLA